MSRCLLCTNCRQTCATEIPVDEIVMTARHEIFKGKRKSKVERYVMGRIMYQRGIHGLLKWAEALARAMGLSPKDVPAPASRSFESRFSGLFSPKGEIRARVAYYAGCATNSLYPETGADVLQVLTHNGIEVMVPEGLVCCGIPSLTEGDLDTVKVLVQTNINILLHEQVDAVITDCTSCGMMFKVKAAKVFSEDDPFRSKIEAVAQKIWEATDYLNHLGLAAAPNPLTEEYTYHIPCHRGWSETLNDAPRNLLSQVPQARRIEMKAPERCCGAGGAFFLENRELSENIRAHKLEDILETQAKTVLTQCPACRLYLEAALPHQAVMHPLSFLGKAYKI